MHHPSYTSPYVREHQVGLSSVLSLPSFSLYRPALCVCVERERVLVVHTHLSLHTSCCSITGTWILFIMALRSCFLLHSIGLARKPAYVLSSRNDRLLFVQDYTHAYLFRTAHTHIHASPAVALFSFSLTIYLHFISHYHIYIVLKKCICVLPGRIYTLSVINLIQNFDMNIMVLAPVD